MHGKNASRRVPTYGYFEGPCNAFNQLELLPTVANSSAPLLWATWGPWYGYGKERSTVLLAVVVHACRRACMQVP